MARLAAALVVIGSVTLAACDGEPARGADAAAPGAGAAEASAPPTDVPVDAASGSEEALPAFAELYPGADVSQPLVSADGASGPGGMTAFTTDASPEAVIDFYRQRAESAGLTSQTALNQGETRAYGAVGEAGATVQVVAGPGENGVTSVQLTWSAGR
ncbi:hypothetical protein E4M02_11850 [Brevundimonas sp. S30B]|uniref:hypothetical protein n=1 Tax=unclassified Brevundimonas TaxID=2622653 RepID=UPI001072353A|nr:MULTISPECIES: hypothetical protein [unclassified Brevundimonas]QBX38800.1 hypothetical protein E4M01_14110 [Brevundimonas sp. MF30-B]TFW01392.1 hypothetical protein E4M02_11850 [Brevundimonas sp. S30B]